MKKYILPVFLSLFIGIGVGYYGKYRTTTGKERFNKHVSQCSAAFEVHEKMLRNCGVSFQTINDCYVVAPETCNQKKVRSIINKQEFDLKKLSAELENIYIVTAKIIEN